jgi:hypothetical protein
MCGKKLCDAYPSVSLMKHEETVLGDIVEVVVGVASSSSSS